MSATDSLFQVTVLDWRFQGKHPVSFISVDLSLIVHEMINNRGRVWMVHLLNRLVFCMTLHFCLFGQHLNWWANVQGVAIGRLCVGGCWVAGGLYPRTSLLMPFQQLWDISLTPYFCLHHQLKPGTKHTVRTCHCQTVIHNYRFCLSVYSY